MLLPQALDVRVSNTNLPWQSRDKNAQPATVCHPLVDEIRPVDMLEAGLTPWISSYGVAGGPICEASIPRHIPEVPHQELNLQAQLPFS
jgi:hypothetical protein